MITRRDFLTTIPGGAIAAAQAARGRVAAVGMWMGAVTADSIVVKVLATGADVPLSLTIPAGPTPGRSEAATTDADGIATFTLAGLSPRTRYRFAVSAPGERALEGVFRTLAHGPFSFRVVFASCASTGSNSPVFTAMREQQPDLFIHLGDLHYENINRNDVGRFRQAYHQVLASPQQSALFRSVPFAYVWDDHDFGPNNSDGTSRSRPAAVQAYRRFIPHYPLADPDNGPVHHAFTVGRVRFLLTDSRADRSPDNGPEARRTMLGVDQLRWLERELADARDASMVVLVNTVPWITKRNERTSDGWARYASERRHIADLIVEHGLTRRLVMLSGDAHMLAMDDGTHSQYSTRPDAPARGFVIAHAGPMDRRATKKGGPYSHPEVAKNGQFGVMTITDEGGPITVRLQGMRGAERVQGMEMTLTI